MKIYLHIVKIVKIVVFKLHLSISHLQHYGPSRVEENIFIPYLHNYTVVVMGLERIEPL